METYKTISTTTSEILYKEKGSKFIGYAYPITTENEIKPILETLKKEHHQARHICYAYQIGIKNILYRANDDGEPNNTAGLPILGQIKSFELTNTLLIVVRYFGGTKLGVSGLIQAYKTTAKLTLEESFIVEKDVTECISLTFEYEHTNKVMRIINDNKLKIISQTQDLSCKITLVIKPSVIDKVISLLQLNIPRITVEQA